jgi:3-hydroxyisobutyrate dehydrogenase-like beta-hydroxyacid dehydrogenase
VKVTLFGLGEAGTYFANGLVAAGVQVAGFDPADVASPDGIVRFDDPVSAAGGADLLIALTASADAETALTQGLGAVAPTALYADLSTSAPSLKRRLATIAGDNGVTFVDVALMAVVAGRGLRTPSLASGAGAERYASLMRPLEVPVDVVGEQAGDAATHKLLRSVMMKGLAALVIEAMRAADAAGLSEWLWGNLVEEITAADETLLTRLVTGTGVHAVRRLHEMEACRALLEDLCVDPVMTRSTVESLRRVRDEGVPRLPQTGMPRSAQ